MWADFHTNLDEASWTGNLGGCDAGDVDAAGRDRALAIVNMYRAFADLPAVDHDPTRNAKAQECALMMDANNSLSHDPPMSWTCYSADGAEAAGKSNISSGPGVMSVDMYMSDFGNLSTMGHRRWILSNGLGPIGLGSTSGSSCMWVIGGSGGGGNPWTAWPAPGAFPVEAIDASFESIDSTGWTIQSSNINLDNASITVTRDGVDDLPVQTQVLAGGYGSAHAIRFAAQGWTSQAGHDYTVTVTGISEPIEYTVNMVACE